MGAFASGLGSRVSHFLRALSQSHMGWNWTPDHYGKGQTAAKSASKGSGKGQAAKGQGKHGKVHAVAVRPHVNGWMCAVCMHDGNEWTKGACLRCKSGWQDSFPKANGGNGSSKVNWAKHAGLGAAGGKGHGGKWQHVPTKHPPRVVSGCRTGLRTASQFYFNDFSFFHFMFNLIFKLNNFRIQLFLF